MNLMALVLAYLKPASLLTFVFAFVFSCNPKAPNKQIKSKSTKNYTIISPAKDNIYSYSDTVHFEIASLNANLAPDSIHILSDGKFVSSQSSDNFGLACDLLISKFGRKNLRIKIFYSDSLSQILTARILILPDGPPKKLEYKIIRQIPHNSESSTQGLAYYKGKIYEGTGQWGKSKIQKIDPSGGGLLLERNLGNNLFGEGIVIHEDRIYQLTYKSMLGFVYDPENFEQIREFDLQTAEGWGLTSDGKSLIVSDGSSALYFYDPVYFSQTDQLEVCDNRGFITRINELEYVDGDIWANVYGEKYILQIDAKNGKVIGKLDLDDVFPKDIPDDMDHVLNGIAFNSDNNSYYITGKLWPVIYEILIFP